MRHEASRSVLMAPPSLSAGDDGVRLWDTATDREQYAELTGHSGSVRGVAFSPDGTTLASAGDDGVRLWDTTTGEQLLFIDHSGSVRGVAFSPDGTTLASAGDDGVRLWDTTSGELRTELTGHTGWVRVVRGQP